MKPTTIIVMGATGDLVRKKIAPALFSLFEGGRLPERVQIMGFARRPFTDEAFRAEIASILTERVTPTPTSEAITAFTNLWTYFQGQLDDAESYQGLRARLNANETGWGETSNALYYLAVAPHFFEPIFSGMEAAGLNHPSADSWTRVVVEKPFGKDLATATALDAQLTTLFSEEQIYRIDHYLAKEMIQNILVFRFSNSLFEGGWDNRTIEKIDIRVNESIGVEGRGAFYDGLGTLRDVGQNHLLQMLAFITMEHPKSFHADSIRGERARILESLALPSSDAIAQETIRAQYEGYRTITGVAPDSMTETFFRITAKINTPRWQGVPISLESGKRMGKSRKEIVVTFKHPTDCLSVPSDVAHRNTAVFTLEPSEGIMLSFWSKKPGLELVLEPRTFEYLHRQRASSSQYVEEYEKLLLDCLNGDQTLFVSEREVRAMWRFIDPIVRAWSENRVPLRSYAPDTDEASHFAA